MVLRYYFLKVGIWTGWERRSFSFFPSDYFNVSHSANSTLRQSLVPITETLKKKSQFLYDICTLIKDSFLNFISIIDKDAGI